MAINLKIYSYFIKVLNRYNMHSAYIKDGKKYNNL